MRKEGQVPRPYQGIEKTVEHELTIILIVIGVFGTVTKELVKELQDLEITGRMETVQTTALLNTENSPGDLR